MSSNKHILYVSLGIGTVESQEHISIWSRYFSGFFYWNGTGAVETYCS